MPSRGFAFPKLPRSDNSVSQTRPNDSSFHYMSCLPQTLGVNARQPKSGSPNPPTRPLQKNSLRAASPTGRHNSMASSTNRFGHRPIAYALPLQRQKQRDPPTMTSDSYVTSDFSTSAFIAS